MSRLPQQRPVISRMLVGSGGAAEEVGDVVMGATTWGGGASWVEQDEAELVYSRS